MPKRIANKILANLGKPEGLKITSRWLRASLENYGEALAMAEAGEQALAQGVLRRSGTGRKRILVVGHEHAFSPRLAEYSLSLAKRMNYALVFLSVEEIPGASNSDPGWIEHTKDLFTRKASDAVRPWLVRAATQGLEAGHVIRIGNPAQEVEGICRDLHRIELIISDPVEGAILEGQVTSALFTVD